MKTLFTRIERFLLRNNRKFVLNSSDAENYHSSSSDSEFPPVYTEGTKGVNFAKLLTDVKKPTKWRPSLETMIKRSGFRSNQGKTDEFTEPVIKFSQSPDGDAF